MATVLFVSVRRIIDPRMRIKDLEPWVLRAWAISVAKASTADRVVALVEGRAIAAWDLRGAFPAEEIYTVANGDTRPRVALARIPPAGPRGMRPTRSQSEARRSRGGCRHSTIAHLNASGSGSATPSRRRLLRSTSKGRRSRRCWATFRHRLGRLARMCT